MDFKTISLGEDEKVSVPDLVRSTIKIALKERALPDGGTAEIPCVIFSTNKGKGTGAQVIPLAEFSDYVAALRKHVDAGFDAAEAPKPYYTASEMVDRTIGLDAPRDEDGKVVGDPDTVAWRVASGKGAKPAKVPLTAFSEIVDILESRVDKVREVIASLEAEEDADEGDNENE